MLSERRMRVIRLLFASVICCSSLSFVGAGPAGAANTAAELLVDPADRATPLAEGGVRPFGGADRYETAVRLAERYAHERGGLDAASAVILVSGETPLDGAVAAGLAARESAPILFTRPTGLPGHVAGFIEDHAVSEVIVIGGTGSVPDEVLAQVAALNADMKLRRIAGDDRYATSAAIASELDGATNWCGTNDTVALLANGDTERIGMVAATGPLAYAMEIPVLLTGRDILPDSVADALAELRIDRVVMVGNPAALSDSLISQLVAVGVDSTERVVADTPEAAAAAVANLMVGTCDLEIDAAKYTVGLVGTDAAVDAVAAGPLLGLGVDGSGPVPLLFVGSPMPPASSTFLRTTRTAVDGRKTHTALVAIGGAGAISDAVTNLAIQAATTSKTLSARISAMAGTNEFRVTFSEQLVADVAKLQERMRDLLYVNDAPAGIVDQELSPGSGDECERLSTLTVELRSPLEAGDVIQMRSTDDWFATNGDRRPLSAARYTVPTPRATAPRLSMEIIAVAGHTDLVFAVEYDSAEHSGSGEPDGIAVDAGRVRILAEREVDVAVGDAVFVRAERFFGRAFYRVPLTSGGGAYALGNGDLVDLRGGAAGAPGGVRSGRLRARVSTSAAAFGVSQVQIGPDNPGVDDRIATTTPDEIPNVSERAELTLGEAVRIVGNWSGSADGARGNGWEIDSSRASARVTETASAVSRTNHPAVRVWVDAPNRVVLLRFIDSEAGEPPELTHGELVGALSGNSAVSRQFLIELVDGCGGEDVPLSLAEDSPFLGMATLSGGISSVSFLVQFTDYAQGFLADDQDNVATVGNANPVVELIDDVLGGLIPDYGEPADPPITPEDRVETTTLLPYDKVLFRFTTADPAHTIGQVINVRRSRIEIAAGIAQGYAPDDPATADVNESQNPAKTLIGASSRDQLLRMGHPAAP